MQFTTSLDIINPLEARKNLFGFTEDIIKSSVSLKQIFSPILLTAKLSLFSEKKYAISSTFKEQTRLFVCIIIDSW